jgi:hypothetical protein
MEKLNKCAVPKNSFCFVCGKYVLKNRKRQITATIKAAYKNLFGLELNTNDDFTPNICCATCERSLYLASEHSEDTFA